ncbi:hypothetical protein AGMMS50256_38800 [Betaproteobacteria bacterium]|nr:hypothetical protein AGMMS50256_38800 [Betaproteobacteria bacterium]
MKLPSCPVSRFVARVFAPALAAAPFSAFSAGLPTMEDPSRGQGSGILQTLQNYGYDIVMLVALTLPRSANLQGSNIAH